MTIITRGLRSPALQHWETNLISNSPAKNDQMESRADAKSAAVLQSIKHHSIHSLHSTLKTNHL